MYHAAEAGRRRHRLRRALIALAVVCVLVCAGVVVGQRVRADMAGQATSSIRQAVLDSAVQCYAIEGVYPSNVDYLEENYGLQVNHDDYIISYQVIAPTVAPDVQVLVRGRS